MRIRSELTQQFLAPEGGTPPPDSSESLPPYERPLLNTELHNPANAAELAEVREHLMHEPRGVLLDVYQAVTSLELKHPIGSVEGKERYLHGLRGEVNELHHELLEAFIEHPHMRITDLTTGPEDSWLLAALDTNRIRFHHLSPKRKEKYLGELGDVLWYTSRFASECGVSLSRGFLDFIRAGNQTPLPLEEEYYAPYADAIPQRAAEIFDESLVQSLALSQKAAFYVEGSLERDHERLLGSAPDKITIDSQPHRILDLIGHDLFPAEGNRLDWEDEDPYEALPHPNVTVGRLVWFIAYTSHTILNAELSTVIQANLEKITQRSRRGTIFSREDRDQNDESGIHAPEHRRMPVE
jgi:hypothetical protein